MIAVSAFVVASLLTPAAAPPSPEVPAAAAPQAVVRAFYTALAAGQLERAASFWSAADAAAFVKSHTRAVQTRCMVLHRLDVGDVAGSGDEVAVEVEALWTRWSAMARAQPYTQAERATVTLRRDGDRWKIAGWVRAEEQLVQKLLAARDAGERWALLREAGPALRTRHLVELLVRRVVEAMNQRLPARAAEINAVAWTVAAELDDVASMSAVTSAEAILLRHARDRAGTLRMAETAAEFAELSGDPDVLARALMRLARAQEANSLPGEVESAERSLALADYVEDATILAHASSQMARHHDNLQRPREALRFAKEAARYAAIDGDPSAVMNAELNLAGNYFARRDFELAAIHVARAADVAGKAGFKEIQAGVLEDVAYADFKLTGGKRVMELTDQALSLLGSSTEPHHYADIHIMRAEYLTAAGELECADAEYEKVVELFGRARPDGAVLDRANRGRALLRHKQGRPDEAMAYLDLTDWSAHPDVRAVLLHEEGRSDLAIDVLETAIEEAEKVRAGLDDARQRTMYFHDVTAVYVRLIEIHAARGELRQAVAVAERMKAKVLKDRIAGTWADLPAEREAKRLNEAIGELNRRLLAIQSDGGDTSAVRIQLRSVRAELDEVMARVDSPRPAPDRQRFDLGALLLPRGTTVVEYVVSPERTTVFVLEGDDSIRIRVHTVEVAARDLRNEVQAFVQMIEQRDARYRAAAQRLYDRLLRPVIGDTPSAGKLCLIPDDVLWKLPFQALVTRGGRHLIESAPLYYAPSLSMLTATEARPPRDTAPRVLALGNPVIDGLTRTDIRTLYRDARMGRLPDAEREVHTLARIYGPRITVGTGPLASESAVKRRAPHYDVVHLATHGLVDVSSPMYSALLLAGSDNEDGLLEAREIVSLPLGAELVVLSACDTARGDIVRGEGVIGLSWAILATGCPRTVATQWSVGSAAAADLMIAFHRRLAKLPRVTDVAECLREAQLQTLRNGRFAHPYYWAGFILIGRDE